MRQVFVIVEGLGVYRCPAKFAEKFISITLEVWGAHDVYICNGHHTYAPCGHPGMAWVGNALHSLSDHWIIWE